MGLMIGFDALLPAPLFHQVPGGQQWVVIKKDAFGEGRHGQHVFKRLVIKATDLQVFFNPHFRKEGRQVDAPVFHAGAFPFVPLLQELAKGHMGHINPLAFAHNKIHGNIQRVFRIVFKPRRVGKSEWQQTTPPFVRIGPDVAPHGHKTVQTPI